MPSEQPEQSIDKQTCPACKVEYTNHLGLIGTCKRLQDANKKLNEIRALTKLCPERGQFQLKLMRLLDE